MLYTCKATKCRGCHPRWDKRGAATFTTLMYTYISLSFSLSLYIYIYIHTYV